MGALSEDCRARQAHETTNACHTCAWDGRYATIQVRVSVFLYLNILDLI